MKCPNCGSSQIFVVNSRSTKEETQIWRRRKCEDCGERFTTHETIDLTHLVVIKKSGKRERFSRAKLYSGIFWSTHGSKIIDKQKFVDEITSQIERKILFLKKKVISTEEIAEIVLKQLSTTNISVFLRFLSYREQLWTKSELDRKLKKYLIKNN